jgi:hypothetical protein
LNRKSERIPRSLLRGASIAAASYLNFKTSGKIAFNGVILFSV